GYGLTESAGSARRMIGPEESTRYGSAGLVAENLEAKIVDAISLLSPGHQGELWLRGPIIMSDFVLHALIHSAIGASDVIMMGEAEGKARVVASFDGLLGVEKDYQTTTTAFNMKIKTSPSFTVSKLPHKPGDQVYFVEPPPPPPPPPTPTPPHSHQKSMKLKSILLRNSQKKSIVPRRR
ncbi:hypothetical protein MKX01_031868, partial [Papaver californicum]